MSTTIFTSHQKHIQAAWKFFEAIGKPTFVMAPMVHQSELAFRQLCRRYNTHLCYTPMIHSRSFADHHNIRLQEFFNSMALLEDQRSDRPLIAQFGGNVSDIVLRAAKFLETHVDGVDINLGCPQGFARKQKIGAYLLEESDLICEMVKKLSSNLSVPVTCKIRLVPGEIDRSVELALRLQDAGCSMLAVHGRYRTQTKDVMGMCDWHAIRRIKRALSIPVLANGGIETLYDAQVAMKETEVDGVMVSEAILSDPKMFVGGCKTIRERIDVAKEYVSLAEKYKRDQIRSHLFKILYPLLIFSFEDLRPFLADVANPCDVFARIETNLLKCKEEELLALETCNSWYYRDLLRLNPELEQIADPAEQRHRVREFLEQRRMQQKEQLSLRL